LIHIGYGVEFQIPIIVAEGLAEAAVHKDMLSMISAADFWNPSQEGLEKITDILEEVRKDSCFDNLHNLQQEDLFAQLRFISTERAFEVKHYAKKWNNPEKEDVLNKRIRELYETCMLLYGATTQRPDKKGTKLDFVLMHCATSIYFVPVLFPHLTIKQRASLLDVYFASLLVYYIGEGRPKLYPELVLTYTPKTLKNKENPWMEVIEDAVKIHDPEHIAEESHVLKLIRSLMKAQKEFGSADNDFYLRIAQLTVEGYRESRFFFGGVGYEKEWEEQK